MFPKNLMEAKAFYESYQRRHYVSAEANPEGVQLAAVHLNLLNDLLPQTPLRRLGMQIVPRVYMEELIGTTGCERIGIQPVPFLFMTKWLIKDLSSHLESSLERC